MMRLLFLAAVSLLAAGPPQASAIEIHGLNSRGHSSGHSSHQTMMALRAMGGQGSLGLRVYTSLKAEARMETEVLHLNQNLLQIISKLRDSGDKINKLVVLPNTPQVSELTSLLSAFESTTAAPTANATGHHKRLRHHKVVDTTTAAALASSSNASTGLSANTTKALVEQRDLLKGLFAHLKGNIAKFNKEQADSKGEHEKTMKQLEKRFEQDSAKLKDPKLSAFEHERLTNLTRAEDGEIKYWRKGRQLQQTMFHANLKITHGLMSRSKAVMDAYQQALTTGHLDTKTTDALKGALTSLPKAFIVVKRVLKREGTSLRRHIAAREHLGIPP